MQCVPPCVALYLTAAWKKKKKKKTRINSVSLGKQGSKGKKSLSDLLPQEYFEENTVQFYTSICSKSDKPTKKML